MHDPHRPWLVVSARSHPGEWSIIGRHDTQEKANRDAFDSGGAYVILARDLADEMDRWTDKQITMIAKIKEKADGIRKVYPK
jgi:hypothetical protein